MAIRAGGGVQHARRHRLSVNACPIDVVNILVALRAGGRHVLLPNLRARVGGRKDVVHAVAVVARCGVQVALLDGAAVHALLVGLHRPRHLEHVLGRERGVGMALAAGVGKVRLAHRRFRVAGRHHLVRRAVATLAGRRVAVHFGVRPAVNAQVVLTHFRGMAGGAELGTARGGVRHIMRSVADDASRAVLGVAQHRVRAGAELRRHIVMAGQAGSRRRFRRVPTLGGPGMAVHTTQVLVNAVRKGAGIYRDGFSLGIHHPGLRPVAGKTVIGGK